MFAASKTASVSGGYQISRSLRFNSADSAYLARTPASASNQQIWTINTWVKRSKLGTLQTLLRVSGVPFVLIDFTADDKFSVDIYNGSVEYILKTTQVFRDVSAWGMMTIAVDTTQATASNRVKIYWNGVQITSFVTADYPPQNNNTALNSTAATYIGGNVPSSNQFTDFYLTEFNLIDGQQLTPSSFGETSAQTGVWQPKAYSGSYGTNGFYLNFSDNSNTTAATLGKDYSGNGNNWTPNNFSVSAGVGNDSFVDVPTPYGVDTGAGGSVRGNYSTLNPLFVTTSAGTTNPTLANGNLNFVGNITTDTSGRSTIGVTSGKWYCEVTVSYVSAAQDGLGIAYTQSDSSRSSGVLYRSSGDKCVNNTVTSYGTNYVAGSLIGIALDADANTVTFYNSNNSQGAISFTPTTAIYFSTYGTNASPAFGGDINFGQRPFAYTAPSGFKALCTQNLPTPTIGATTATQANKYFDIVLRNGGGSSGGTYSTTVNMANGALLWDKPRNQASSNYLIDSVRGISKLLASNGTSGEATDTAWFTNFGTNSYTTGATDWGTGVTIVDWIWAAGTGTSNTSGSITSTVGASATSGFSIVTYTGTGVNATVGHGLGVAPSMVIVKRRDSTSQWRCYNQNLGYTYYINLNDTGQAALDTTIWNSAPTSSVFGLGTNDMNTSTATYVAYCFAEVAGYSAFGSYTGNGSNDGPFVFTGFRPAYVMIKRTDTTNDWIIFDTSRSTYNQSSARLFANATDAESTGDGLDFLSNGFKLRVGASAINNASGGTYIYACFASAPLKYSLAR